ncbi:MAG: cellulase family glycosylhydrolase [Xanthobacteraceae bacterium]
MRICESNDCRRSRIVALCCAVAVTVAGGLSAAVAAETDFIHADGKRLVDGRGETFAVKGINLGNWLVPEGYMFKFKHALSPAEIGELFDALIGPEAAGRFWSRFRDVYVAKEDIAFIKAAGFNTVRVPLDWRLFVKPGGADADAADDRFAGPGWALIDRLVQWCHDAGLRVIIDLHAAPGGQTGVNHDDGPGFPLTFYVPRYRQLTIALWQRLAAHYRDETAILGYDLLNEPISPYSDVDYLNPQLEPLYRDIVAAIRSVDPNHAVLLGGAQWDTNFAMFDRPFDRNAIYTYHKFWITPTRDGIQEYLNFSNRWNVPVLIGETGEFNNGWNDRFRRLQERFGLGWIFWPYKNLDSDLSVVSIPKPAGWDLIANAGSAADAVLPPRGQAQAILDAYLEAAKFEHVRVNNDYIASLGLTAP